MHKVGTGEDGSIVGSGYRPLACCGKLPHEVPATDSMTWIDDLVTCGTDRTEGDSLAAELDAWKRDPHPVVAADIMGRMLTEIRRLEVVARAAQ
ncbi:hypothetical protein SEA_VALENTINIPUFF_47 [Microbacterium phage ValentiniPuff]|uniref:Uncharacterized protein n=1 Tax=Microbacterium phage ValentiniPuff TaxID=2315705 RepID=A0A386KP87_9CAUD|nr:hypothetical protein SEA_VALENTINIPUFF_47 [Microbacterium phage ValentiniPuff]